ncbi:tail fiber protein [Serratia fonticola]|uniref:phage tail protein n=1 Tax=Serratia fonticola TaxID=47917 RepID=UPI001AE1C6EC|nr:phage tail protein [Serratia fonticola]MBP1034370.1 tail fiber protein [Serratia fonticola]
MFHLDNASSVPEMPQVKPVMFTERRFFTEGGDGIAPSYPGADWFNIIQMEMLNVLALANIAPDKTQLDQFAQAIRIFSSDYMLPPGIPLPWPGATAPTGFGFMLGQMFNKQVYTRLALAYPNGIIPDMRGQTIKFLPASGRSLLSYEGDGVIAHNHGVTVNSSDLGTVTTSDNGDHDHQGGWGAPGSKWGDIWSGTDNQGPHDRSYTSMTPKHNHTVYIGPHAHTASIAATGNTENTVKNIAFNAIVRLA